jgi:phosphatidylglycerol:prolipoprotein diacylglycerol transferase
VTAAIPYTTFPQIDLGPVNLRTFGVMSALGVVVGIHLLVRHVRRFGFDEERVMALAVRLVLFGFVGARVTYVLTHLDEMESIIDPIAVWKGGLQFSGGFVFAVAYLLWWLRKHPDVARLPLADGFAYGLAGGLFFGRVGCYSVGEHFGRESDFFLASEYQGGNTVEPAVIGESFHHTALYEGLGLIVLFGVLTVLRKREPRPGTLLAVFCVWYGVQRFFTDSLRAFDDRTFGMTGAQMLMIIVFGFGVYLALRLRRAPSEPQQPEPEPLVA